MASPSVSLYGLPLAACWPAARLSAASASAFAAPATVLGRPTVLLELESGVRSSLPADVKATRRTVEELSRLRVENYLAVFAAYLLQHPECYVTSQCKRTAPRPGQAHLQEGTTRHMARWMAGRLVGLLAVAFLSIWLLSSLGRETYKGLRALGQQGADACHRALSPIHWRQSMLCFFGVLMLICRIAVLMEASAHLTTLLVPLPPLLSFRLRH